MIKSKRGLRRQQRLPPYTMHSLEALNRPPPFCTSLRSGASPRRPIGAFAVHGVRELFPRRLQWLPHFGATALQDTAEA